MSNFTQIAEFGKELMSMDDIDKTLELVAKKAKKLVDAERCSVFIVDTDDNMLWTRLSDGIGRIVIALNSGVVGDTYNKQKAQIVNNPYEDSRFLGSIDNKSGFKTESILSIPIFDSKHDVMGVIQLLNKNNGVFDAEDLDRLVFFANYVSGSIELILMNEH